MHAVRNAVIVLFLLAASLAQAAYPERAITIVVPYPPGGSTDVVARTLGRKLTASWNQPVVVENKPGAAGSLGTEYVSKAAPDGYTMLLSTNSPLTTNLSVYKSLSYSPLRDFTLVALVVDSPMVLVVNPQLPARSLAELTSLARQGSGRLFAGTSGNGATTHLALAALEKAAGVKFTTVPYKGGVASLQAVMTNEVQVAFSDIVPALPLIRGGQLRVLGVPSLQRSAVAPEVPTLVELGIPGFDVTPWTGIAVPRATPADVSQRLSQEINRVLKDPDFNQQIVSIGQDPLKDVSRNTPERLNAFLQAEIQRWQQLAKDAEVKIQ